MADTLPTETFSLNFEQIRATDSDSFDFTAREGGGAEPVALLLPAVQAAREAARRTTDEPDGVDTLAFTPKDEGELPDKGHDKWIDLNTFGASAGDAATGTGLEPITGGDTLSLLLPAVQAAEDADAGFDMIF